MPVYTDKKFQEQREAYIRENGYSIVIPKFRDIVHIGLHKPITPDEKILWYSGKRNEIPKQRQIELQYQKLRNKERYEQMLASPIPNWKANIVSFLTAWDDAQDAIISLAALGRIACKWLPKVLVRWVGWPIGLLWLIATIMGLLVGPTACALSPMQCKRYMRMRLAWREASIKAKAHPLAGRKGALSEWERALRDGRTSPWSDKVRNLSKYELARLKAGLRGYATSGGYMPSFSEAIQMLQTTDQIYGIGVCLGPLLGLAMSLGSGGVRWVKGEKVSFKNTPSDVEVYQKATDTLHNYARWKQPGPKMSKLEFLVWKEKKIKEGTWGLKSQQNDAVLQAINLSSTVYGFPRRANFVEETAMYGLSEVAWQGVRNVLDVWDPIASVDGLEHIQVEAYNNPNPLIEEMLTEEGIDPEQGIGWPVTGNRWSSFEEIYKTMSPVAAGNIRHFSNTCPDERLRAISEMSATGCGLQAISFMTEEDSLEIRYHAAMDIAETLLDKRYSFPTTTTQKQMNEFALWTQAHEDNYTRPDLRDILGYAKNNLGFEFKTR